LNGTDKQFELSWDGSRNAVLLTPGTAYTQVGGELAVPANMTGAVAYLPTTVFYMGKRRIPMRSYTVNSAHYMELADLAANLMFASGRDDERHLVKISTEAYYTGIYSFSLPEGWSKDGSVDYLELTRSGDTVGSLSALTYDEGVPISRFEGNHAETLSSRSLSGFAYPAAEAIIRRTQPAAAQDDSYVDELHIYILLAENGCAFDFCFDSAKVDEATALEIAKGFTLNESALKMYGVASQWAKAIQDRDGRAQYELLSADLQSEFHDCYENANWVTGMSSPWVNSFTIEVSGNSAIVFYEGMTSTGFAGYTIDSLSFTEEDGQLKIGGVDGYNNLPRYNTPMQKSVPLPETRVLLSSLPDEPIAVYGDKGSVNKAGDLYEGLYLSINGVNKYFAWESMVGAFGPELSLADLNGDGKKELIVILTTASGTGVHLSDIHVIDPETFKETYVADPLDIIRKNVASSVVHENGTVTITLTVNGKKSAITFSEDYAQGWAEDQVVFGNIIRYAVDGTKLKATVPAQVSNTVFTGDVEITYAFDGYYAMESINFVPYNSQ
jgi:hypothetical protein